LSFKLLISEPASVDFEDAFAWYETQDEGVGAEFAVELERTYRQIAELPFIGSPIEDDVRLRSIDRFPFCVYYRVRTDHVEVLGVLHNHRDPAVWRRRLSL